MSHLPEFIKKLIALFDRLPGIGPRQSYKLVYWLLQEPQLVKDLTGALDEASDKILFCTDCQNISDQSLCFICRDPHRQKRQICVVASSQDLEAIEKSHNYQGLYHILHGTINAIEGIGPEQLKVRELLRRLKDH